MVYVGELRPGVMTRVFAQAATKADIRTARALTRTALLVEREAKNELRKSSHRYGTPTPASPGGPPALVSGTLRRAMTHDPVHPVGLASWETRVGTATGYYPTYRTKRHGSRTSKTPANLYGLYLETGLRNGATYPFLSTAYRVGIHAAPLIWRETFHGGDW